MCAAPVSARCRFLIPSREACRRGVAAALLRPTADGHTWWFRVTALVSQFKCWFSALLRVLGSGPLAGVCAASRVLLFSWLGESTYHQALLRPFSRSFLEIPEILVSPRKASAELDLKERRSGLSNFELLFLLSVVRSLVCKRRTAV